MNTSPKSRTAAKPRDIVRCVAASIREGDLDGVVSMFHPECKIAMDPQAAPLQGHEAVRAIFSDFVNERLQLEGVVSGEMINGDTAILQGRWSMKNANGDIIAGGESTEVAKQLDHGGWVYYIDCPFSVPVPDAD